MKKPLSLNTQLTKMRTVINLLKNSVHEASYKKENGFTDTSLCEELKQVIYSLRDIHYMLRGLDYKAHRSYQTRKMTISEVRIYLKSLYTSDEIGTKCKPLFREHMLTAYNDLDTVEQYMIRKGLTQSYLSDSNSDSLEDNDNNDSDNNDDDLF